MPADRLPPREKLTLEEHRGYSLGWGVLLSFLGLGVGLAGFVSSGEIRSAAISTAPYTGSPRVSRPSSTYTIRKG